VCKILEPLKVRHSDTTTVHQQVGKNHTIALAQQNVLSSRSGWAVGSLDNDLGLNALGIATVDLLFESSGNEDVAWLLQDTEGVGGERTASKAFERALGLPVGLKGLDIQTYNRSVEQSINQSSTFAIHQQATALPTYQQGW
jgi:hypothetical protein